MTAQRPVVLLCTDCPAARIIYHRLRRDSDVLVLAEDPVPRRVLLRRRLRRLGPLRVAGQLLFLALVVPVLRLRGAPRIREIRDMFALDERPMDGVRRFRSANSEACRAALRSLHPAVVIVCGTRILDRDTIRAAGAPVVNYHAGITPAYRGIHGGYWALAEGRRDQVGSTLHLVDEGIDTGPVVDQRTFEVTARDSFVTYPYLHVAAILPALEEVVRRTLAGRPVAPSGFPGEARSKLWTHPTLWQWVRGAWRTGVR